MGITGVDFDFKSLEPWLGGFQLVVARIRLPGRVLSLLSPRVQRLGQIGAVLSEPGALVDFELEENDILGINRQSVRRAVGQ